MFDVGTASIPVAEIGECPLIEGTADLGFTFCTCFWMSLTSITVSVVFPLVCLVCKNNPGGCTKQQECKTPSSSTLDPKVGSSTEQDDFKQEILQNSTQKKSQTGNLYPNLSTEGKGFGAIPPKY